MLTERAVNLPALTVQSKCTFKINAPAKLGKRPRFRLAFGTVAAKACRCRTFDISADFTLFKLAPACIEVVVYVNTPCVCLPLACIFGNVLNKRLVFQSGVTAVKCNFHTVGINTGNNRESSYPEKIAQIVLAYLFVAFH